MLKSKKIFIINVLFLLIVLSTIIAFVVLWNVEKSKSAMTDDIFGSYMDGFIGLIFLIPVLFAECDIFYIVRYIFLPDMIKSRVRTAINIFCGAMSLLVLVLTLICIVGEFFYLVNVDYDITFVILGLMAMCFVSRIAYFIVKLKK